MVINNLLVRFDSLLLEQGSIVNKRRRWIPFWSDDFIRHQSKVNYMHLGTEIETLQSL